MNSSQTLHLVRIYGLILSNLRGEVPMQDKMTWEEIKKSFPNEWVALDDYQLTEAIEVSGTIIAHHPNKKEFYTALSKIRDQHPDIAVRYTGKRIKNSEIPLLWQITGST